MLLKNQFFIASLLLLLIPGNLLAQAQTSQTITPENQAVLDRISADSLRGHLSFIASDLLEGRATPSRGLDIAAEYIAAQFRRAGLEAVGDDGYFQTAYWLQTAPNLEGFSLTLRREEQLISVPAQQISFAWDQAMNIASALLVRVDYQTAEALSALKAEDLAGTAIITELPDLRRADPPQRRELQRQQTSFLNALRALKPALIIAIDRTSTTGAGVSTRRTFDPERRSNANPPQPVLMMHDPNVIKLFDALKPGASMTTLSLKLAAAQEQPVKLRNVVGLLRGSDPELKDTYVLVTAHYDHVGMQAGGEGDRIFNGANDDGSGTVSVIELASALTARKTRPKRSIVFMTVFGEERGLLGSRYYGRHPIFPIEKTVADVNLEQVGRTDDTEGSQVNRASLTGFDFSDIGATFQQAGALTGISVFKHPNNSDAFFGRSDNQALADQGVPAHTLCVAFVYPDYHGLGDHWEKVDYDNMARTNRMVALGLLMIADNPVAPKWNEANPKTARYVEAWKKLQGK
ncbi:MAG TPA: M28 family peptidase [Blastocatellia bacterium]|nr:M28 family peptidase [Blastocatellia bacterium]